MYGARHERLILLIEIYRNTEQTEMYRKPRKDRLRFLTLKNTDSPRLEICSLNDAP